MLFLNTKLRVSYCCGLLFRQEKKDHRYYEHKDQHDLKYRRYVVEYRIVIPFNIGYRVGDDVINKMQDHWDDDIAGPDEYDRKREADGRCLKKSVCVPSCHTVEQAEEDGACHNEQYLHTNGVSGVFQSLEKEKSVIHFLIESCGRLLQDYP